MLTALSRRINPLSKPLTWRGCTVIVGAIMLISLGLSVWWPVWFMPPHFNDTTVLYGAISQLWLVALMLCAVLHPAAEGWQRMLKLFLVGWPFTAIPLWQLSASIWFALTSGMQNANPGIILVFIILSWTTYIVVPVVALQRWLRPENDRPLSLLTDAKYLAAGIGVAILLTLTLLPNVTLASGGLFTAPLTCTQSASTQEQVRYTCREEGRFASKQTYSLEGWPGVPIGQLRSHPGNDNIGG